MNICSKKTTIKIVNLPIQVLFRHIYICRASINIKKVSKEFSMMRDSHNFKHYKIEFMLRVPAIVLFLILFLNDKH